MERIRNAIFIVVIFIIIVSIVIFIFWRNPKDENNLENLGAEGEVVDFDKETTKDVTDTVKFFTVKDCVYQYYDQINQQNDKYYGRNEKNEYALIVSQKQINQDNLDLLSKEYIQRNNITVENVKKYIDTIKEKVLFTPLKMRVLISPNVEKYIVYGFIQNLNNEFIKEVYLIVNLDVTNHTFSIEPIMEEQEDIKNISITNDNQRIQKNENNQYVEAKINYETVAKEYFTTYKRMFLTKPEIAYRYLQKEYKDKRFGNQEEYEKFIEKNLVELKGVNIAQYVVNHEKEYTEYVCKDQYDNLYIFREDSNRDFSILLDTYTITTDEFKKAYTSGNEQKKVMLNIDQWVQMLNNRDYQYAYQMLDTEYANKTFRGNEEIFESYMREKYPSHYSLSFTNFTQTNDVFIQTIKLKDLTNTNAQELSVDIIMKLEDNMKYTLSFTVVTK